MHGNGSFQFSSLFYVNFKFINFKIYIIVSNENYYKKEHKFSYELKFQYNLHNSSAFLIQNELNRFCGSKQLTKYKRLKPIYIILQHIHLDYLSHNSTFIDIAMRTTSSALTHQSWIDSPESWPSHDNNETRLINHLSSSSRASTVSHF